MRVTTTVHGLDAVQRSLSTAEAAIPDAVHRVLLAAAEDALDQARALSPVDTGELRDAWVVRDYGLRVELVNEAEHAPYVVRFDASDVTDVDRVRETATAEVARLLGAR